ncbi:MAG: Lrp/AsnC ligand binding domain-containing protein [Candidatus Thermoplasmatota archaeon]
MDRIYVLAKFEGEDVKRTLHLLRGIEGVKRADMVTGTHDIVIVVEGTHLPALLATVVREIRMVPGIHGTETLVVISDG